MNESYSQFWCHLGEFTKGPQPCGCGKPSGCPDREKHIGKAIGTLVSLPRVNPAPYSSSDFQVYWLRGGLIK